MGILCSLRQQLFGLLRIVGQRFKWQGIVHDARDNHPRGRTVTQTCRPYFGEDKAGKKAGKVVRAASAVAMDARQSQRAYLPAQAAVQRCHAASGRWRLRGCTPGDTRAKIPFEFPLRSLLRAGKWQDLDYANRAEEFESLGKWDERDLEQRLEGLLIQLLTWWAKPEDRCGQWQSTIRTQRYELKLLLRDKSKLRGPGPSASGRSISSCA